MQPCPKVLHRPIPAKHDTDFYKAELDSLFKISITAGIKQQ